MADLSALLNSTSDELAAALVPVGTWDAQVVGAKIAEGKKPDKNGDEYSTGMIFVSGLANPGDDVDPTQAKALNGDLAGETFTYRQFIYNKADLRKFMNTLTALGIPDGGRKVADRLAEVKKVKPTAKVEVSHNEYNGRTETRIDKIYPMG